MPEFKRTGQRELPGRSRPLRFLLHHRVFQQIQANCLFIAGQRHCVTNDAARGENQHRHARVKRQHPGGHCVEVIHLTTALLDQRGHRVDGGKGAIQLFPDCFGMVLRQCVNLGARMRHALAFLVPDQTGAERGREQEDEPGHPHGLRRFVVRGRRRQHQEAGVSGSMS